MISPRPMAPLGRADLLAALVHLAPAERGAAAAMLGFAPKPAQAQEGAAWPVQRAEQAAPLVTGRMGDAGSTARREPLKFAHMVVAQPLVQAVPDSEVSPAPLQALSAAEIAELLDPRAECLPVTQPIWPQGPGTRRLADGLQRPPMVRAVDWSAAAGRLARLQPLRPLPRSHAMALASHVAVILDDSPGMAVYRQDAANLIHDHMHWRSPAGVELWLWPPGASCTPVSLGGGDAPRPWSAHTAVLLISRLDGEGDACLWPRRLAHLQAEGSPITLLFPGAAAELPAAARACSQQIAWTEPGTQPPTAGDLQRLMQALSVFTWVDAAVVRACRRAFAPRASASLDAQVWHHPALRGQGGRRPWVPAARDALATALHDRALWSTADLLRLAELLLQLHQALPAAEQGLELLNVAAALHSRGAPLPEALAAAVTRARQQQARLASHALLAGRVAGVGPVDGGDAGRAAAFAARSLLAWPAPSRRAWSELASQWYAASVWGQVNAGRTVDVVEGVEGAAAARWLAVKVPDQSVRPVSVQLAESGLALCWGYESDDSQASCRTLGRLLVTGDQVQLTTPKGVRLLTLPPGDSGRVLLAGDLPSQGSYLAVRSLLGGDAGLMLSTLQRPRWAAGWWRDRHGVMVEVPTPWGELVTDRLHPRADIEPAYATRHSKAGWAVSVDEDPFGLCCDMRLEGLGLQRFRYIAPGTFLMGSSDDEAGSDGDEHPRHPVTLTRGLWLADTPCTQGLWQAVMGSNPSLFNDAGDAAARPVENVSWNDVQAFFKRLQALLPDGLKPVLPTEAEWEYACRAGRDTAYAWGDDFDPAKANVDHGEGALNETNVVKRYPPNAWGLYDLHGNVWEWCADGKRDYGDEAVTDPRGPEGPEDARVLRGGSFYLVPVYARSAYRFRLHPGDRDRRDGFRFALRSPSPGQGGPAALGAKAGGRSPSAASAEPTPSRKPSKSKRKSGGAA